MLKERLELTEFEINNVMKDLAALYEQIAIKNNSSTVTQNLYDEKRAYLAQLICDKAEIEEILKKNHHA